MSHAHWYDRDGQPITTQEAEALLGSDRHIGDDYIGPYRVSTVHLVLDQSLGRSPVPLIFETMVFSALDDGQWQWRTATKHAALAMHDQVCTALRNGDPLDSIDAEGWC